MVPGMQHCGGGPGPDAFGAFVDWPAKDAQHNMRIALEDWVEKGAAPNTIIASKTADGKPQGAVAYDEAFVPVSAGCEIQGQRRYKQRGEFYVRGAG